MPNAWQDYTALIFAFYNRSDIIRAPKVMPLVLFAFWMRENYFSLSFPKTKISLANTSVM